MSLKVLLSTYGYHHPDYLADAVDKIAMRDPPSGRRAHISSVVSGAPIRPKNEARQVADSLAGRASAQTPFL